MHTEGTLKKLDCLKKCKKNYINLVILSVKAILLAYGYIHDNLTVKVRMQTYCLKAILISDFGSDI